MNGSNSIVSIILVIYIHLHSLLVTCNHLSGVVGITMKSINFTKTKIGLSAIKAKISY
jgi:hypothetical protein